MATKKIVKKTTKSAKTVAKKAVKKTAKKSSAEMTPLEKARAARAANLASSKKGGKAAKKTTSTRAKKPSWKAPGDYERALFEVDFMTENDGLPSSRFAARRIKGSYEKAPERQRRNVAAYDPDTMVGIASRISSAVTVPPARRLQPNTHYRALFRTGPSKDKKITCSLVSVWYGKHMASGRTKQVQLERSDPQFRVIMKAKNLLPAAFQYSLVPPKLGRGQTDDE